MEVANRNAMTLARVERTGAQQVGFGHCHCAHQKPLANCTIAKGFTTALLHKINKCWYKTNVSLDV